MTQKQFDKNRLHDIHIHLLNSEGYFVPLNTDYVMDLQIEDNFLRWWVTGYIDIKNEFDFLEKGLQASGKVNDVSQVSAEQLIVNPNTNSTYVFRNDGEDYLAISIQVPETPDDIHHTMLYMLNVYDVQDFESPTQTEKIKRLYFRDEKYHRLKHTNLSWSTADLKHISKDHRHLPDSDRSVPTGQAIKFLIGKSLGEHQRFAQGWDYGAENIFYTSPVNNKCSDDLDYLVSNHVSSAASGLGMSVLMFDRSYKMWRLVSLHDFFFYASNYDQKTQMFFAGDLQSERFHLMAESTGDLTEEKTTPSTSRVPRGGDGVYTNVNFEESSIIKTLKFKEMSSTDNLELLLTTPVHIHDNSAKRFYIKQQEHNLKSIYKKITSLLTYLVQKDRDDPSSSIDIRKHRSNNKNMKHVYDTESRHTSKSIYNKSLNSNVFKSVMLSNSVEFVVPGEPLRQAGRFISIDPHSDSTDTEESAYHNKVYGQYLVLSCTHRLQAGKYTNKIVGIKPYNYSSVHRDPELAENENYKTYEKSAEETES